MSGPYRGKALVLAALSLLVACAPHVPDGWSERKQCDLNGSCRSTGISPDGGRWLGFQIGMSREAATKAACRAVKSGEIKSGGAPVEIRDGTCGAFVTPTGRSSNEGDWFLEAPGLWCWPFGAPQLIVLEFKRDQLARISGHCRVVDP